VMAYPGVTDVFEVEFLDADGKTIEVRSVRADELILRCHNSG